MVSRACHRLRCFPVTVRSLHPHLTERDSSIWNRCGIHLWLVSCFAGHSYWCCKTTCKTIRICPTGRYFLAKPTHHCDFPLFPFRTANRGGWMNAGLSDETTYCSAYGVRHSAHGFPKVKSRTTRWDKIFRILCHFAHNAFLSLRVTAQAWNSVWSCVLGKVHFRILEILQYYWLHLGLIGAISCLRGYS